MDLKNGKVIMDLKKSINNCSDQFCIKKIMNLLVKLTKLDDYPEEEQRLIYDLDAKEAIETMLSFFCFFLHLDVISVLPAQEVKDLSVTSSRSKGF